MIMTSARRFDNHGTNPVLYVEQKRPTSAPLVPAAAQQHEAALLLCADLECRKGATQSGEMRLLHICNQSCGASNSIMHSAVPCGVLFRAYQERSGHVRFTCTRRKRTNPPAWPP